MSIPTDLRDYVVGPARNALELLKKIPAKATDEAAARDTIKRAYTELDMACREMEEDGAAEHLSELYLPLFDASVATFLAWSNPVESTGWINEAKKILYKLLKEQG